MPASRNKVIYGYWLLSSDFRKTSWIFLHDPVCPKNLVRSVLKPGPFCPGTWSVLSLDVVRFVLKRGPFCLVRFVHGPFCPSTYNYYYRFGRLIRELRALPMATTPGGENNLLSAILFRILCVTQSKMFNFQTCNFLLQLQ